MICVSIGRGRHRHVIAEHRHLVEQGATLVELRLDYINGDVNIKRLITDRPCPVVISCRRERDGGKWAGTEEQRRLLLRTAIAEGVEYIDLEDDIAEIIPRYGSTKRIISHHDFRKTPEDLEAIHARLSALDADLVKIACMANHPQDNLRVLELVRRSPLPMIGLCMGDIGVPSRILCGKFGAPFSYATFHHERTLAPGQLSFQQMNEVYRYEQIRPDTEVFGVVADPVGHSLSPLIHNAGFAHFGMNRVYVPFRVPREDLSIFVDQAPQLGVCGLSVTIPHKEAVIPKLEEVDDAVKGIGACNTLVYREGKRFGFNTDYTAAMASLEAALGIPPGTEQSLYGKTALVLGSGGVGRAIGYGLTQRGARVVVTDGMSRPAAALAKLLNCAAVDWTARHLVNPDILLNCTPIGMHPEVDATPFDRHYLKPSMLVFDAVYNPENTLLVKDARGRNCAVVTGVDMFVRQACIQFQHFTQVDGPAELMRDVIKRATSPAKV